MIKLSQANHAGTQKHGFTHGMVQKFLHDTATQRNKRLVLVARHKQRGVCMGDKRQLLDFKSHGPEMFMSFELTSSNPFYGTGHEPR